MKKEDSNLINISKYDFMFFICEALANVTDEHYAEYLWDEVPTFIKDGVAAHYHNAISRARREAKRLELAETEDKEARRKARSNI